MKRYIPLFSLIILCGCASNYYYAKDGVSEDQKNKDFYECERDMRQSGYFGGGIAGAISAREFGERCLVAKGYEKKPICTGPNPYPGCP